MRTGRTTGFTLIELLVVIGILALLIAIVVPSVAAAKRVAAKSVCGQNLRSLQVASVLYYENNNCAFFPYQEARGSQGTLWYWGLEPPGLSPEGSRRLDKRLARLAPYFQYADSVRVCPSVSGNSPYFKPKFSLAGYGYAINWLMLAESCGPRRWDTIAKPFDTIHWADSMQINTFQAPASPTNPMLEEWYYLSNKSADIPNFHFRHLLRCNAAFADGSVHELKPCSLDPRCDGLVGRPEKPYTPVLGVSAWEQQSYSLRTGAK